MSDSDNILAPLKVEWTKLLNQAVERIQHCVAQLSQEQLWWRPGPEQNSIGALMRHLAGNLNQWVVDGIPQRQNKRDRQAEFDSEIHDSAEQLTQELCRVVEAATQTLQNLTADDLTQQCRIQEYEVTVLGAIMHSVPHFVGHTHQIVQITRLQLGDSYRFHWDPDGPRDVVSL